MYDNTQLSDFKTCPRYYYLRHIRGWRLDVSAIALINGLAWHDAMDAVWKLAHSDKSNREIVQIAYLAYVERWKEQGMPDPKDMPMEQLEMYSPRGPHIALETLVNYVDLRRDFIRSSELIAVELPFAVPLDKDNPKSKTKMYIGRLDKVIRHPTEGLLIIEHKTTSLYGVKTGLRPQYIDSWSPNSQIDGYLHAANMLYKNVQGVWIDAALFHKTHHNIFKFIPISKNLAAMNEWLEETLSWIEKVEEAKARLEQGDPVGRVFPKNTGACSNYAGCAFRDICRFFPNPTALEEPPNGYVEDRWNPFDVLKLEKLGLTDE